VSFLNTAVIAHEVSPSIDLRWPLHGRLLSGANEYFDGGGNRQYAHYRGAKLMS
jgi:hypothetical protein